VTTYPVELPGGFSGLSAGQIQGIAKAPFTGHFNNAPMLGDRRPKTLIAATGAWYFDNAPHGDYSGTEQNGTGGPAQMEFRRARRASSRLGVFVKQAARARRRLLRLVMLKVEPELATTTRSPAPCLAAARLGMSSR
jgi:hypothetical protein